jgi:flagellar motor switch protein FliN
MNDIERWLISEWSGRLQQALESMTGEQARVSPASPPIEPTPEVIWWCQPFELDGRPEVWVGAAPETAAEIGGLVLKAAGIPDSDPEEIESTYQEILSQALSSLAQALGGRLRREVACGEGSRSAPGPGIPESLQITVSDAARPAWIHISPALLAVLSPQTEPATAQLVPHVSAPPFPRNDAVSPMVEKSKTLDLLLEVELPVSISFGRAQLRLKDVIKLTTGSIVELNRSVTEPVEVIVNNCVIARGEVVVIDGYYGVRIHQIVSRQERLRTLT